MPGHRPRAPAVTLTGGTTSQPTFAAPTVATATTLTFSLVVTDNRGATSAADTVDVHGQSAAGGQHQRHRARSLSRACRIARDRRSERGLDYASPVQQPSRGVLVRALNAALEHGTRKRRRPTATATTSLTVRQQHARSPSRSIARMLRDTRSAAALGRARAGRHHSGQYPYAYTEMRQLQFERRHRAQHRHSHGHQRRGHRHRHARLGAVRDPRHYLPGHADHPRRRTRRPTSRR